MKQKNIGHRLAAYALSVGVLVGSIAMLSIFTPIAHAQTAVPVVSFNGTAQTFSFQNVETNVDLTGATVPDLFASLKSIVPGDRITQNITLSVRQIPSEQQVTIYLQAQSENDDYTALLESATLQVVHDGQEITQSLSQPVALGVFNSTQTKETAVTLTVPISAGNEISGLSANIDWIFFAEYAPETTPTTTPTATQNPASTPLPSGVVTTTNGNQNSPKTGDINLWWLWVLAGGSMVCGVYHSFLINAHQVTNKTSHRNPMGQ